MKKLIYIAIILGIVSCATNKNKMPKAQEQPTNNKEETIVEEDKTIHYNLTEEEKQIINIRPQKKIDNSTYINHKGDTIKVINFDINNN